MYECPSCGRLWVQGPPDEAGAQRFHAYRPEGEARGVFGSRQSRLSQAERERARELDPAMPPPS